MNITAIQNLITNTLTEYGTSILIILGAVLTIGVAYLVFRFGWKKLMGADFIGGDNWNYNKHKYERITSWGEKVDQRDGF